MEKHLSELLEIKEEQLAVYAGPPHKLLGTPKIADGTGLTQCCSMELILFFFCVHIKRGFRIWYAGPDHHPQSMSKAIYYPKIFLLSHTFKLYNEEAKKVKRMSKSICLFY